MRIRHSVCRNLLVLLAMLPSALVIAEQKPSKYDVDVIFAPRGATLTQDMQYQYLPGKNRICLRAHVTWGENTDAYRERTAPVDVISEDLGLTWRLCGQDELPEYKSAPVVLPDGTVVELAGGGYERYPRAEADRLRKEGYCVWDVGQAGGYCSIAYAVWMRRSKDGGKTWEEIEVNKRLPFYAYLVLSGRPYVLDDGTLLHFAYGVKERLGRHSSYVLLTKDGGNTWDIQMVADAVYSPASYMYEVLERADGFTEVFPILLGKGRIFCMVRSSLDTPAFRTISNDYGRTWSTPKETPILAKHPIVTTLKSGAVLCTYQRRSSPPYGIRARVTRDLGETWSDEYVIRDDFPTASGHTPYTFELSDGSLFTVFDAEKKMEDGSIRSFMGATHWVFPPGTVKGESKWTAGYRWIPELAVPPRQPKMNNEEKRGRSPW